MDLNAMEMHPDVRETLELLWEYMDNRADAEYFTDSPNAHPNEEMTLMVAIEKLIGSPRV